MLELYHNINSVCAQKVRIALAEKGQKFEDHILTLRGDQNEPAYLKLNPNGRGTDAGSRRTADRGVVRPGITSTIYFLIRR